MESDPEKGRHHQRHQHRQEEQRQQKQKPSPSLQSESQSELENQASRSSSGCAASQETAGPAATTKKYLQWVARIKGLETRGIEPVPVEERHGMHAATAVRMMCIWFSMTLATNNLIVGSLGTLVFRLSFTDAALCAVFGVILGNIAVAYISTWGPRSGNRTLVLTRFFMGYYPTMICVLLNVFTNLGYSMLNCVVGGQILSKVSGGNVSVILGIIIVSLSSFIMATFGMRLFQLYERYAWLPQLMMLCIMLGSSGSRFDLTMPSVGTPAQVSSKRLTFLSLCLSVSLAWAPLAADYYVYYPPNLKRWKTGLMTVLGATQAMSITLLIGAALGTAVATTPHLQADYDGTPGNLVVSAYGGLGAFGKFCAVINVLAVVASNSPGAYSTSMNFQMLGNFWSRFPRPVFTVLTTVVYTSCAMGGRNSLCEIFKNFLPLIGYWIVIWLTIVIEEDLLFKRGKGYDWSAWNDRQRLPLGIAAGMAFLIGWAGAIVGMDQVYYTGPIARAVVEGGCDLGVWLAIGFTAIAFPPLRMLELWKIGW